MPNSLGDTPLRTTDTVLSQQGFESVAAITPERVADIEWVGSLELAGPALRFAQYPSEFRVQVGDTTTGLLTIEGESDNTYWWTAKTPVMRHGFVVDEDLPRFLMPTPSPRSGADITRDVGYAACTHRVRDGDLVERWFEVADVAAGHLVGFDDRVIACAAGTRHLAVALTDLHAVHPTTKLVVLDPDGTRHESAPRAYGDQLAMSWCDELLFHTSGDGRVHVCRAHKFEPLGDVELRGPSAAILFFGGVLFVAEPNAPRVSAYALRDGDRPAYVRPPPKPLRPRKADWAVRPQRPAKTTFDLGGRTVVHAYVDGAPTLVELPDTPLASLRKKKGDDPTKLKKAQAALRKKRKSDAAETPAARRRSFAEAAVSGALRRALRGGPDAIEASALRAELDRHGRAYEGIAWRTESGAPVVVRKAELRDLSGAPVSPVGRLRIAHRAELDEDTFARLCESGLCERQRTTRVFRASDLQPLHRMKSGGVMILGAGGGAKTDDTWAAKRLVGREAFVLNTFAGEPHPCFDLVTDGVVARWVMDLEHGTGWLQFLEPGDDVGPRGPSLAPESVPPRAFSIAVDVLTDIYQADHTKNGLQAAA